MVLIYIISKDYRKGKLKEKVYQYLSPYSDSFEKDFLFKKNNNVIVEFDQALCTLANVDDTQTPNVCSYDDFTASLSATLSNTSASAI